MNDVEQAAFKIVEDGGNEQIAGAGGSVTIETVRVDQICGPDLLIG